MTPHPRFRSERRRRLETTGDPFSPEARARIQARKIGAAQAVRRTPEQRAWADPEKRARQSAQLKAVWANPENRARFLAWRVSEALV